MGGGACALPRYVAATRPKSRQLVFELDAGVVALAREHLGLRATPRLRVKVGDAAELIRSRHDASADLVIGDAFDGPHVPAQLSDGGLRGGGPARAQARRRLRAERDRPAAAGGGPRARRARARVFEHVAWVAPPGVLRGRAPGNVVLLASAVPLPLAALRRAATAAVPREQVSER